MTTRDATLKSKDSSWLYLDTEQIRRIDKALAEAGDFGEVRLIKAKGKLRFIQILTSQDLNEAKRISVD
jgi:hypothetical protein